MHRSALRLGWLGPWFAKAISEVIFLPFLSLWVGLPVFPEGPATFARRFIFQGREARCAVGLDLRSEPLLAFAVGSDEEAGNGALRQAPAAVRSWTVLRTEVRAAKLVYRIPPTISLLAYNMRDPLKSSYSVLL